MSYFEGLIEDRKIFLNQVYNLVKNQFKAQERLNGKIEEIIEILDNDTDYIQRIFIDAPWGMGKSYFAKAFKEKVISLQKEDQFEVIKINAWETDYYSEPMKTIIGEMNSFREIEPEIFEKSTELLTNATIVTIGRIIKNLFLKKLNLSNDDILEIKSVFSGMNEKNLKEYEEYKKLVREFKKTLSKDNKKKIILIDELDRCKPPYAIEFLETVKHMFGVKNLIFIFLVNKEQLGGVISTMYLPNDKSNEYFEKFFDLELKLPEMNYQELIEKEHEKSLNLDIEDEEIQRDNFISYIFFEIFKANYTIECISVRKFLKILKKFKLLISTLSDEEKSYYILIIYLIIVYLEREILFNIEPPEVEGGWTKKAVLSRTFFDSDSCIKTKFFDKKFYKNLRLIFNDNIPINLLGEKKCRGNVLLNLDRKIQIKKVYKDNFIPEEKICFTLPYDIFEECNLKKYETEQSNKYNIKLIEEWAIKKCNFLNKIDI